MRRHRPDPQHLGAIVAGEWHRPPRLVIMESPYSARWWLSRLSNRRYARQAMRAALAAGDVPLGSHLLYALSGVLRDRVPAERAHGINAGIAWGERAAATLVYVDRGVSAGMRDGIRAAHAAGRPVEFRSLKTDPAEASAALLAAMAELQRAGIAFTRVDRAT